MIQQQTIRLLMTVLMLVIASTSQASEITPSHVYQKTESLKLNLQKQGLIDMTAYKNVPEDKELRHPRHVIQKVRECHTILTNLLAQQKIDIEPLPDLFSVSEVRPEDVLNGVNHLLKETILLGSGDSLNAALEADKMPRDVYNNLKRICASIRADVTIKDIYQLTLAINENLDGMAKKRDYDFNITPLIHHGKNLRDVYKKAFDLLLDLRLLALNPDFAIPGGVIVASQEYNDNITARDIISLMYGALAETSAMHYTLGERKQTALPSCSSKQDYSGVFSQVERAHRMVTEILKEEAKE